jgi:phosphoglycerate dehydrogenase-like enzyme
MQKLNPRVLVASQ